jgi:cellulose synthase operon protein YhjQ
MIDPESLTEHGETPDDVASLYTWANLHGAKYRDFSADRAQTREKARLRAQQGMGQASVADRLVAEGQPLATTVEPERVFVEEKTADERLAEARRIFEQELAAEDAHRRQIFAEQTQRTVAKTVVLPEVSTAAPSRQGAESNSARLIAPPAVQQPVQQVERQVQTPVQAHVQPQIQPQGRPAPLPAREDAPARAAAPANPSGTPASHTPRHDSWEQPVVADEFVRPAWLTSPSVDAAVKPLPQASQVTEDTLQGSRERVASRWFALQGVFNGSQVPAAAAPTVASTRVPVLAVFSLAGGVGKTSLVATLGRALSERGERVLLVDTSSYGLLPFYFGAQDQRSGVLRTFSPPGPGGDAPIQMLALDPDAIGAESAGQEYLTQEVGRHLAGANRVIIDLATASGATTRRALRLSPIILVPVIPDMNSVVSVGAIEAFFRHNGNGNGTTVLPHYVLNQFDAALPLHLDVREILREQLGDRLLPFALRRCSVISDALAEGMTVMDYAPNSTAAEDFNSLAGWLKGLAAAANSAYRGVRWSER